MRLIWLSVNSSYSHSSLALPLLHHAARDIPGWEWHRCETTIAEEISTTVNAVVDLEPDLVCATLYLFNRKAVLAILARVYALLPRVKIAVGGPESLGLDSAEQLAAQPFIHSVFRGEGESVFPEFLRLFPTLPGQKIFPPSGISIYKEWADSEPPVLDVFFRTDKPFVQLETSRGCPMGCRYCTSCHAPLRFKDLSKVREELRLLRERGVSEIRVLDRTFNYPSERGAALLRLFRTEFSEIHFHLEIHPQLLSDEIRKELSSATPGQLHLEAGIQSLDPNVQRRIGRNSSPEAALEGLRFLCGQSNFETHTDLLSGLPGQTLSSLFSDIRTLIAAGPAEIQLEILKILPGTPLREDREDLIFSPEVPYEVLQTASMSRQDIATAGKLSRILDLTYNHTSLHAVIRSASAESPDFLSCMLQFFEAQGVAWNCVLDLKKRFLLLWDLLNKKHRTSSALFEIAYQWALCGYPIGEGPGILLEKAESVPASARLLHGTLAVKNERETKYWTLNHYYFAFHRKYEMHRPAAVWKDLTLNF